MSFGFGTRRVFDNDFTIVDSISGANRVTFDVQKPDGVITLATSGRLSAKNIRLGNGTPESVVTGDVGDIYQRTDGSPGTALYIKESGTGNTGWTAFSSSSGGSSTSGGTNLGMVIATSSFTLYS